MLRLSIALRHSLTQLVHDAQTVLCHSMALLCSLAESLRSLLFISLHTIATEETGAHHVLSLGQSLLRSLLDVLHASGDVDLGTGSLAQGVSQPILGKVEVRSRSFLEEQHTAFLIWGDLCIAKHLPQVELGFSMASAAGLLKPSRRLLFTDFAAQSISKHRCSTIHGFQVVLFRRSQQPFQSSRHVLGHAVGGDVHYTQLKLALSAARLRLLLQCCCSG
mmetsp:Transcript_112056/g.267291  ORF Transcript_112056/g.267291 Transcript_112056/m.267291 type:complete len:220 (-) Transcript_112056:484-1143(-)